MEEVSLILGNDLAGRKVIPKLQVVTVQAVMKDADGDAETTSHIFLFTVLLSLGLWPEN